MSFGLSNIPKTFQALMNDISLPYLRKFILAFFDDILVYSLNMAAYLSNLLMTLQILKEYQLMVKRKECSFVCDKV